jgi:hypothetical protein
MASEMPVGPLHNEARMKKKSVIDRDHFLVILQTLETQHQNLDVLATKINKTLAQAIRNSDLSNSQLEEMRADAVGGDMASRHPGIAEKIRTIQDIRQHIDEFPRT